MSKPYDSIFKSLAEDDPRGLLCLLGNLGPDQPAEVEVLPRDLELSALAVDTAYRVRAGGREWVTLAEAQTRYERTVPERVAFYGYLLGRKYGLPVEIILVLMAKRYAPREVPDHVEVTRGDVTLSAKYRVLRLWEEDPKWILEAERPSLLPWVPLLRSNERQMATTLELLYRLGDRKLHAQCAKLTGLRYDRSELAGILERLGTMVTEEILMRDSSFYELIMDRGIAKGEAAGQLRATRRAVRSVASLRFPALGELAHLDNVHDAEALERMLREVVLATSETAARRILGLTQ